MDKQIGLIKFPACNMYKLTVLFKSLNEKIFCLLSWDKEKQQILVTKRLELETVFFCLKNGLYD